MSNKGKRKRNLALVILSLLVTGILSEAIAQRVDARRFPPPGRLITVGDHRLHLDCRGTGNLTVVFESGSMTPSPAWALVAQEAGGFARVCTYDRAGYGWSESARTPRTAEAVTGELHTLLQTAGEGGPYLLVAHSLGGLYARAYAARYPQEVSGLVLVDTRTEESTTALARVGPEIEPPRGLVMAAPVLLRSGIVRPLVSVIGVGAVAGTDSFQRLPAEAQGPLQALLLRPALMAAASAEAGSVAQVEAEVRKAGTLGDLPVVVLSHGRGSYTPAQEQAWREDQQRMAALSTRGRFQVAEQSGHYIQVEQPELVVQAIREVMQAYLGRP